MFASCGAWISRTSIVLLPCDVSSIASDVSLLVSLCIQDDGLQSPLTPISLPKLRQNFTIASVESMIVPSMSNSFKGLLA